MRYCFDQFASNMCTLRKKMLDAAVQGEEIELTFVVSAESPYTAGSLHLRVGEATAWFRVKEAIGPNDDAFQCVVGSKPDAAAVEEMMIRAFAWVETLRSPQQRAALELERALHRAVALAEEAGVEDSPLGYLLRAARALGGVPTS